MHDVSSPIFFRGDEFAFSLDIFKPNGFTYRINPEVLYTEFGFLIPFDQLSLNILDMLETKGENFACRQMCRALFLTHEARLYELTVGAAEVYIETGPSDKLEGPETKRVFNKQRLFHGFDMKFARAVSANHENMATAALYANKTLDDAIDFYCKGSIEAYAKFKIFEVDEVVEKLKKRGLTEPLSIHRYRPVLSAEEAAQTVLKRALNEEAK